jgi:hypothetical protein
MAIDEESQPPANAIRQYNYNTAATTNTNTPLSIALKPANCNSDVLGTSIRRLSTAKTKAEVSYSTLRLYS